MKIFTHLMAALCAIAAIGCDRPAAENLIANGDFESGSKGWTLGENTEITGGVCQMKLSIPRYHTAWNEMCRRTVTVEPDTDYRLSAEARMSLYPISYGVYIGVRTEKGEVLHDRLFLLARDNMTPMQLEFNSGDNTRLTLFCGTWCDRDAIFEADNFGLFKKH